MPTFREIERVMYEGTPAEKARFFSAVDSYMDLVGSMRRIQKDWSDAIGWKGEGCYPRPPMDGFRIVFRDDIIGLRRGHDVLASFSIDADGNRVFRGEGLDGSMDVDEVVDMVRGAVLSDENLSFGRGRTFGGNLPFMGYEYPDGHLVLMDDPMAGEARELVLRRWPDAVFCDTEDFLTIRDMDRELSPFDTSDVRGARILARTVFFDGRRVATYEELDSPGLAPAEVRARWREESLAVSRAAERMNCRLAVEAGHAPADMIFRDAFTLVSHADNEFRLVDGEGALGGVLAPCGDGWAFSRNITHDLSEDPDAVRFRTVDDAADYVCSIVLSEKNVEAARRNLGTEVSLSRGVTMHN